MPKVSVILAVYNGEKYIKQAMESILDQSFSDFEFIIVDDGSTDDTEDVVNSFQDQRLIRLKNHRNFGLSTSINTALAVAHGEFIARMDADDISLPQRLAQQVSFLDTHPEVGVLGTGMQQVDSKGVFIATLAQPTTHQAIFWKMFFDCAINHATVLMRRDILIEAGGYNTAYMYGQDVDLWGRLIFLTQFANLPDALYLRRLHYNSVTNRYWHTQNQVGMTVRKIMIEKVLGRPIVKEEPIEWLSQVEKKLNKNQAAALIRFLLELYVRFVQLASVQGLAERNLRLDLGDKIISVSRNSQHALLNAAVLFSRKLFSVSLRYRLRHSFIGRHIVKYLS